MATSNQQRQELHKTIWAVAEDIRSQTDIKELNGRIRRIVLHENELRVEIDKIIADLEQEDV
ncbi:hypothetical protein QVO32_09025 [Bacteroides gallinaceum]|uniref:hypothetical protein n=1 Tax=Bacteroides gallinaceum TaxID=1462571 RepID=UPI0025AA83B9|nr:hypothetical protein [Bacteroides gallinaceum]MDN0079548.1 hypothetical protein [Bacteroides gallinaceum]